MILHLNYKTTHSYSVIQRRNSLSGEIHPKILTNSHMAFIMKKIAIFFLLIVTINAQQNDILKSRYGSRDFDEPPFESDRTEKTFTRIPALFKSSIANSNPEFVSAAFDSVYEDSYLFIQCFD